MYLKRLDILGFKTFATRTTLEFRPGTTAIVGPNGSGKSNVADAVRWVLGEQSYAALRSKRTDDLIFGGGQRRAPAGFAEVSLTIDNSDRLLPLPYSEVTITRRATRNGENEYFINRNRVRLRDLHDATATLGGSYTIINQGLVDSALTLKPDERRRLFEDAAAISTFQQRKTETEARLRETAANVERCADLLAELEPRLRSLKRQAGLARSYRELQTELHQLLRQHYAHLWREANLQLRLATQAEQERATSLEQARAQQNAAVAELRGLREQVKTLRDRLGTLHNESSLLHTEAETLQRELAVGSERLAALTRREEETERNQRELQQRREELERERSAISDRLRAAEARQAEARQAVSSFEATLAEAEQQRRQARHELDIAQREELALTAALTELQRRATRLAEQQATLNRERENQNQALHQLEATLEQRMNAMQAAEQQLQQLATARTTTAQAEEAARTSRENLRNERTRADETVATARRQLADLEARLESLLRLQRSYAGTFAGVKAAMQWAETNQRTGFALVSSLLRTPAELETALEVALGSRLQNIVVEQWADAEAAIEALKRSGAGRATFLPLDTMRRANPDSAIERLRERPGVLGVAAELVEYATHYRDVIWNLLGRTLVVRDLATARSELRNLAGGWTLVTLAGEQVNAGGALTGGAQVKESGTLRRERELRELPEQVDQGRAAVQQQTIARQQLDQRLNEAEREVREAEVQRRRANQEYEAQREAESRARRELERAEAEVALQRRRAQQIEAELQTLSSQAAALVSEQASATSREQTARARREALLAAEQTRQAAAQAEQVRLNELRAAASAYAGELRAEHALRQSLDQQFQRLDQQQHTLDQRVIELRDERSTTTQLQHEREARHTDLLAKIDELRRLIAPVEAETETLEAERNTYEQRETELTATLLEAETNHGRSQVELQRTQDRRDTIWERAAADDLDVETLEQVEAVVTAPDQPDTGEQIQQVKQRIQRLGTVNPLALEEYEETAERYTFMSTQLEDLRQAAESLRTLIAELDQVMRNRFETTFQAIAVEFEACFQRLFGGGQAKLSLAGANGDSEASNGARADSYDTLGVEITVRPPGKRQQTLSLLSGGERALTATALLFAILRVNPTPFCILDEVDAALDEANVGRFRDLLTERTHQTQFLLITHNRGTIEAADTIYGVSMGEDGASRVLSLRLEEVEVE